MPEELDLVVPDEDKDARTRQADEQWEKERKWPLFRVILSGDEAVWVPRADERYWQAEDPDDPNTKWVPRDASDLPEDASLNDDGQVVRVATCRVDLRERTEESAKALALSREPEYHTVVSCEKLDDGQK